MVTEQANMNVERQNKIDELDKKVKDLTEQYNKINVEKRKIEQQNYDYYAARYIYRNEVKMPMKLPKGFMNTVENKKNGKTLAENEPIFVDSTRKKGDSWNTSKTIELVFKRPIPINAYQFNFVQGEPPKPKVEEEKVEENKEETEKKEDGNEIKEQPAAQE